MRSFLNIFIQINKNDIYTLMTVTQLMRFSEILKNLGWGSSSTWIDEFCVVEQWVMNMELEDSSKSLKNQHKDSLIITLSESSFSNLLCKSLNKIVAENDFTFVVSGEL